MTLDWWRGSPYAWCCGNSNHARSVKPQRVRRRNRARHVEIAQREIDDALAVPNEPDPAWTAWLTGRMWRMDDEYTHPVAWREHIDNDEGLAYVDLTGIYTTETGRTTCETTSRLPPESFS